MIFFKGKKPKFSILFVLLLILIVGLFLRIRLAQDNFVHKWDERFHALVSKNVMKHPLKPTLYEDAVLSYDYTKWYSNHVWLHKQPLPLWLIASSYKLFGVSDFNTRIPSIFFSVLGIYITYLLGKHFFGKKTGLLSAFFMAINGLVIEMAAGRVATDHYDLLFMVFIEIAILFAYYNAMLKRTVFAFVSGVFIGMAILTKWLPALVVILLHFLFLINRKFKSLDAIKQVGWSALAIVLIVLPWQVFIWHSYPSEARWEYYHNWLHIAQELDGQGGGFFYFLGKIRINYSEVVYVPLLFLVFRLVKKRFKNDILLVLFVWIFIPLVFFSLAKTKMQGYIMFISPALFMVTASFFFELKKALMLEIKQTWLKVVCYLMLVAIIVLPLRYCFERTAFGVNSPKHSDYVDRYKVFKNQLSQKCIVLNVKEPIEFMFYNDCVAYSAKELTENDLKHVKANGYKLFFLDEQEKILHSLN